MCGQTDGPRETPNNNTNNNNQHHLYGAVIMNLSHCINSAGSHGMMHVVVQKNASKLNELKEKKTKVKLL